MRVRPGKLIGLVLQNFRLASTLVIPSGLTEGSPPKLEAVRRCGEVQAASLDDNSLGVTITNPAEYDGVPSDHQRKKFETT